MTNQPKWLKPALEFGPILLFLIGYFALKDHSFTIGGRDYDGFIVVTAAFVPLMVLATAALWKLTGRLSKMQLLTLVLVVVLGGLTVWFNDPKFIKMKPTMLYLFFSGTLGLGLLRGESWLETMMEGLIPLDPEGWMRLTRRICGLFFALALTNELVWRTMSEQTWVLFKTLGLPLLFGGFLLSQAKLLEAHALPDDDADGE